MAGEPILIVDDTPVNLKLTRILLVNEGYRVLTAASAEEALELVRSFHPVLILADIQLPGMDGLEMTRRIKQDEETRDILVVALTAFAMTGDEGRAIDAGCDGYITKPIDTRALGGYVRELLNRHAASSPAPPPEAERETIPAAEMQSLRRRFLSEGQDRARQLLLELDGPFDAVRAARTVHQWIGTGGLLGYATIPRLAREVESLLHERPVDIAQVRESLTSLALAFATPAEARDIPMPREVLQSLAGKSVTIVGLPGPETQRLCAALQLLGAHVRFVELASTPGAAELESSDLVVTYVHPQSANSAWLDPHSAAAGKPTLFVGNHDDLLSLSSTVQAMARQFLMDGWQPDEALLRLSLALRDEPPPATAPAEPTGAPVRVVIADGESEGLPGVYRALPTFGIEVHRATGGAEALDLAQRLKPRAIVLDINLPGLDSQVLSSLRALRPAMRIVLLTAPQQESEILRAFALGADDYLVRPFNPTELVARLKRLTAAS